MSLRFNIVALACAVVLVTTSAFAQVGGGTELPSDAAGKGTQSKSAGGAGNPKAGSSMKGGMKSKMKKKKHHRM